MKKLFIMCVMLSLCGSIASKGFEYTPDKKLRMAEYAISKYYVDSVSEEKIVEDAIKGMLEKLDPHSSYTDAEETKEMTEPLDGEFEGIGIQFQMKDDTLYVVQTVSGGPCERVGVLAGDRIVAVDDTVIAGVKMKNRDIMKRLRGKKGTKVDIKVVRRGETILFRVTRDKIPVVSIDAAYMIAPEIGYVRISRFAEKTHKEFMDAVKKLKRKGMRRIILDLSDNGGGYLNSAAELANEFLSFGNLIVYTEGNTSPKYEVNATGFGDLKDQPVVVIVNQFSASASEILSGALQDWDRGVIVGRRTFGKGLVQRPFPFPDGSMIRLTVARYYTPSGRCIQKPYEDGSKAYEKDIIDRYNRGELTSADSIHFPDSLRFNTLKHKRVVYGGGGIMPDRFVPLDTTEYSNYYRDLVGHGVLNRFSIEYVDANRESLKKQFKDIDSFVEGFTVTEAMLQKIVELGVKEKVKVDEKQFATSRNLISRIAKALVARDLFDVEAYFVVVNSHSDLVKEALRIISDDTQYQAVLKGEAVSKQ